MTRVRTKQDLLNRLREQHRVLSDLGVKRLGLFGSFARDEQTSESDVDLLVEFQPGAKSFGSFMTLSFLLEDVLRRRVELVTPESLSPYIGPRILREVQYVEV